jgi:hypothetical protein
MGKLQGKVAVITGGTEASSDSSFVTGIELLVDGARAQI